MNFFSEFVSLEFFLSTNCDWINFMIYIHKTAVRRNERDEENNDGNLYIKIPSLKFVFSM